MTATTHPLGGVWMAAWLLLAAPAAGEEPAAAPDNAFCFRCHAWETLADRDVASGRVRDLHVDPKTYPASDHGRLACVRCHGKGYEGWPHEATQAAPSNCVQCHQDEPSRKLRLPAIEQQMSKDVHARAAGGVGCFSCHDPHRFNAATLGVMATAERVRQGNTLCLQCHPTQGGSHAWLPQRERHQQAVRCVECHTPAEGRVAHGIEPARQAERRCESCHSQDSMLLAKLYRHRALEERERGGFVNSVVLNDAYVLGMTRHRLLDGASLLLVGGTVFGLVGHGLGRWWAARRRKGGGS